MRRAVAVVTVVVAVAACSGGSSVPTLATGTTPPPTITVATSPSTSAAEPGTSVASVVPSGTATTTSVPGIEVPIPQTDGEDDFEVIWRELIDYHNWAFRNPELADLDLYLAPECECYAIASATLDEYLTNGWRETSRGIVIDSVSIDLAASTFALLVIVDEHSPLVVVDEAGSIVRERDRRPKTFYNARVRLLDQGWRIVEWYQRGEVGDAERP